MMRKLAPFIALAAFVSVPSSAHAFSPVRYVQISTNSVTQQTGSFNVAGGTVTSVNFSTMTVNGFQAYAILYSSSVYDTAGSSTTTAATFVPTKTTITFTPKRSTSRIEVSWSGALETDAGATANAFASVFRNGSNLATTSVPAFCIADATTGGTVKTTCAGNFIDMPNTTSALTYAIYIKNDSAGTTIQWNSNQAIESTITVKEWSY